MPQIIRTLKITLMAKYHKWQDTINTKNVKNAKNAKNYKIVKNIENVKQAEAEVVPSSSSVKFKFLKFS